MGCCLQCLGARRRPEIASDVVITMRYEGSTYANSRGFAPSSNPQNSSCSSTSRPPRRSASPSRRRVLSTLASAWWARSASAGGDVTAVVTPALGAVRVVNALQSLRHGDLVHLDHGR